jgi:TAG lipase / steryl ester hydrolase / phospholipase A2 / LPA acyltransferase
VKVLAMTFSAVWRFMKAAVYCGNQIDNDATRWTKRVRKLYELSKSIDKQVSYESWVDVAKELDQIEQLDIWKDSEQSVEYDFEFLKSHLGQIRRLLDNDNHPIDVEALISAVRPAMMRSFCNIDTPTLFEGCRYGTKTLITNYRRTVEEALQIICDAPNISIAAKIAFFTSSRSSVGNTALCLSGGGSLAMYHMGILRELITRGILPRHISGTSGGSIVAGVAAVCSECPCWRS